MAGKVIDLKLGPKNISELGKIKEEAIDIINRAKEYLGSLEKSSYYAKQALAASFGEKVEFAEFFVEIHKFLPDNVGAFKKSLIARF